MQARQERTLRAALSALVCTLVTATAHAAAGGGIPHPLVLGLALVAGVALCFALGGRRVTLAHLVLAIGATQGVLHAAFTFGGSGLGVDGPDGPDMAAGAAGATAGSAAHDHAHAAGAAARALAAPSSAMAMPADHDGAMLLAHVIAGILSVCSLRVGADAVRRVARALALRVGGAISGAAGALVAAAVAVAAALAEPLVAPRPRRIRADARPR
ncbi:hypothetical protein, partial [Clavibacter zhangzhiyongii]|uniref:hypothetical protein n=1 Tax=Clavibacter zhangzhiyongii TaxID=2768071 RepID=UPI00195E62D3